MKVEYAELSHFDSLISLAREVEDIFGPMADEESFKEALKDVILQKVVFCISSREKGEGAPLQGGIIVSKETNEIAWLVVSEKYQNVGMGKSLLAFAISKLDRRKDIFVQTFDESVLLGKPARKLYLSSGFIDHEDGGLNPAGVPTVIMRLPKTEN